MNPYNPVIDEEDDDQVRELEDLARELKQTELIYGAAIQGLQTGLEESARAVDQYDLEGKMAGAEEEIAGMAVKVAQEDVADLNSLNDQLDQGEDEELVLLAEEELGPPEGTLPEDESVL